MPPYSAPSGTRRTSLVFPKHATFRRPRGHTSSTGTTLPAFPPPASLAKRADKLSRSEEPGFPCAGSSMLNPGAGISGGLGWLRPGGCSVAQRAFVASPISPSRTDGGVAANRGVCADSARTVRRSTGGSELSPAGRGCSISPLLLSCFFSLETDGTPIPAFASGTGDGREFLSRNIFGTGKSTSLFRSLRKSSGGITTVGDGACTKRESRYGAAGDSMLEAGPRRADAVLARISSI